ncbi:MAG: sigma-70 family RNA polymerase sigma factor [Planctomycetes bacterium]|nr:sigma-70 family RNA polymerase sigma factor [Planctomycetota bacterium]
MSEISHNETELLTSSRNGDTAAFEAIVKKYQSFICAITFSATGDVGKSEVLAQETFISAWEDLAKLKDLNKFQGWLSGITRNVIKNSFKSRQKDLISKATPIDQLKDAGTSDSGPVERVITKEQQDVVRHALQQIPEQYREPLVLFYRQEQSVQTVAEQLDLSEEAVKQRLSRGRKLLKEKFAAIVETTITRTGPGKAFTAAVSTSIAGIVVKGSTAAGIAAITSSTGTGTSITTLMSGMTARIITAAAVVTIGVGTVLTCKYLIKPEKKPDSFQTLNAVEEHKELAEGDSQRLQNNEANTSLANAVKEVQPDVTKDSQSTSQAQQKEKEAVVKIEQMGTYSGVVKDESDKPIAGVVVRRYWYSANLPEGWVDDLEAVTNERGEFELGPLSVPDISRGKNIYTVLLFEHADYGIGWSQAYGVGFSSAFHKHSSIILLGSSVTAGRVVDQMGNGITGAVVIAKLPMSYDENNRPSGDFEISVAATDAKGEFVCTDLPAGSRFHVAVLKKGYEIYDTSEIYERNKYPFRAGKEDLQITLKSGGAIKGQLVLDGRPYQKAGIIVEAYTMGSRIRGRALIDENGQFEIIGLVKTHKFTLTINNDFFAGTGLICKPTENINLSVDAEPVVKLELQKGIPVTIQIVDKATGDGIANRSVSIALYDPNYRQLDKPVSIGLASGNTNEAGEYVVYLTPNYYRLRTRSWADGREGNLEQNFRITDVQDNFNLTVAVIPQPKIRGRLVNSGGKPIRGYMHLGARRTITDVHGKFEADEPRGKAAGIYPCYAFDLEKKLGCAFFWQKSDDANELEIILEPLAGIVGRLIDQNGEPVTSIIPVISIVNPYGKADIYAPGIRDTTMEEDGSFSVEGIPVQMEMVIKTALCANSKFVDIGSLEEGKIRTLKIGHLQPSEVLDVGEVFVQRETIPGFEDDNIDWDGTLSGLLTNESGDVMVGFDLEILYGNKPFHDVTDINGRYEFVGLPGDRKVKLTVSGSAYKDSKTGRKRYRESFEVVCDGNDFDIQLSPE